MKIVTVATDNQRYFPYLVESCKRNECELVVLGWGQKWQGFAWRFQLIIEYLDKVHPDEIICFVDAYDVIVLQHREKIIKEFKSIVGEDKKKVVFAQERDSDVAPSMFVIFKKCQGKYLNAGTYMGYAKAIQNLFKESELLKQHPSEDDQRILQTLCAIKQNKSKNGKFDNEFCFDSERKIFLVIYSFLKKVDYVKNDISVSNKELVWKSNIRPCILHATGNGNIDDILRDLGYPSSLYSAKNEAYMKYMTNTTKHFVFWYIRYNWYLIVIAILSILLLIVTMTNLSCRFCNWRKIILKR